MSRDLKYIGMDVHKKAMVIAVLNGSGKLVMESIVETKASSILQFIHGLQGELHVSWEEGTWAAWLYDLLKPHVHEVLVCNPRRNALLKEGSKSDKVDARKLADLLGTGMLRPVYHGENGLRTLRELARSYQTISKDLNRVMNRLKAVYRQTKGTPKGTRVIKEPPTPRFITQLYVGQCSVEYTVGGKQYTLWAASGYLDPDSAWVADRMQECPVSRYVVRYNPENPSDASAVRADGQP